ncbi:phosphonate C-P lyase system protein PhnG [Pantoea sp. BAV 3049]|uniref:phosphonate C-P lyase system protein PhnG n=1 Tax=Pantoea sp. BAV 3049 TaxID=2654188 RepID=UPI00131B41C3|nr:phosphonate C-P lyase system protein PhnG [Pantoea sp. BAV 3049]
MESLKARQHWLSVLAHCQPETLLTHWQPLDLHPEYELLRTPETGLTRLQARMGGTGRRFILGDTTVTRAVVRLPDGICGYSYVMSRNKDHAELCALMDALLQQTSFSELIQQRIITPLAAAHQEKLTLRAREVASSRVDFFTLVRGDNE